MMTKQAQAAGGKGGRPSKYTPELVQAIGERMGTGEPLAQICRDLNLCDDTVRNWMEKDEAVVRTIARARLEGRHAIAYRLRQTARGTGESTGDVQRDKLIIDTDLKLLAKWDPKNYGDKVQQEISGPDGGPIETRYAKLDDAQLDELILAKAKALGVVK